MSNFEIKTWLCQCRSLISSQIFTYYSALPAITVTAVPVRHLLPALPPLRPVVVVIATHHLLPVNLETVSHSVLHLLVRV